MNNINIINGTVEKVLFTKRETGYSVLRVRCSNFRDPFVAVGHIPNPEKNIALTLQGHWGTHPRYGRKFDVESFEYITPVTLYDMYQYLGTIRGIGLPMADKIVRKFNEITMKVIEDDIHSLLCIPGIGPQHINFIRKALIERKSKRLTNHSER